MSKSLKMHQHHNVWECWKMGLYEKSSVCSKKVLAAKALLSTPESFLLACCTALHTMKYSAMHHISAMSNPNSWIGHSACFVMFGCNEAETRMAWGKLNRSQQKAANAIATQAVQVFLPNPQLKLSNQW